MNILSQMLGTLTGEALVYLLVGTLLAQLVSMTPGLGGPFLIALMLPLTYELEPIAGIALLVGAVATSGTGNSVTTILFGIPGSSNGIATLYDGPAMARNGQAARAIGAALTASLVGGIIGAAVLGGVIQIIRPLLTKIGQAEYAMLILLALVFLAAIQKTGVLKALMAGCLGASISFIGQETGSGTLRFTFGSLYLWEGIGIIPAIVGLFAISEMLNLIRENRASIAEALPGAGGFRGIGAGIKDTFLYWRVTAQSGIVGVIVGLIPGLGGASAGLVAYSQGARIAKDRRRFGEGVPEGVIAAEGASNSKEGGQLVTTLALGIPGGVEAAILLVGLKTMGVNPGEELVNKNIHLVWLMVAFMVLATFIASSVTLALAPALARMTFIPTSYIAGPVLVIGLFGAYNSSQHVGDLITALVLGILGYAMLRTGFSRVLFVVGLVLGPLLETNLLVAIELYGWTGLVTRPGTAILLVLGLAALLWPMVQRVARVNGVEARDR